jgi:hypothetical protein
MLYANRVPGVDASWQKILLLPSLKAAIFSQGGYLSALPDCDRRLSRRRAGIKRDQAGSVDGVHQGLRQKGGSHPNGRLIGIVMIFIGPFQRGFS